MLLQYILVNTEGIQEDVVLLNPDNDEISEFHIPQVAEGLFVPKWDFEAEEWVEGLSAEEVALRRAEIEEQLNNQPPTIEALVEENQKLKAQQDYLEGAVIELAQILLL